MKLQTQKGVKGDLPFSSACLIVEADVVEICLLISVLKMHPKEIFERDFFETISKFREFFFLAYSKKSLFN